MRKKKKTYIQSKEKDIAIRVSVISIFINIMLSFFKLIAGIYAKSGAMISDSIHSASDVFSTFIVIIGVNIANKKSDREHQYGHERFECVAAVILAVILAFTGIAIGLSGINKIIGRNYEELIIPDKLALFAAVISIVVKELMYWYTRGASKKIKSDALMADAWHHRSDALSSIGAFIGIFGARIGFLILDSIASVVICCFIIKTSYDIFKDSINKLVDKSCDEETIKQIKETILNVDGVINVDVIRTRIFGSKIYVDVEILADGKKTLNETHAIAEKVHDKIERQNLMIKHCMVHVNPYND